MQISARNQISGIVELITNGTVNAEVYINENRCISDWQ